MIEILLQGILLGGLYTLFALGQSLMFGVMRLTNTAQGDFIILGAFAVVAGTAQDGQCRIAKGRCRRADGCHAFLVESYSRRMPQGYGPSAHSGVLCQFNRTRHRGADLIEGRLLGMPHVDG